MKLELYVSNKNTQDNKWVILPIYDEGELSRTLPNVDRYLIHKFKSDIPNLKLNMSEDILKLNSLLVTFGNFSEHDKNKVLALCEKKAEFFDVIETCNEYELVEDIKTIEDYAELVLKNDVKMPARMLASINLSEYGKNILKYDREVMFTSYGLLRKEI